MDKLSELIRVQDMVAVILEECPQTRDSDNLLYVELLRRISNDTLRISLGTFLANFDRMGLPAFSSVGRARRKLQAARPELRGTKTVQRFRDENEVAVRTYANLEVR